MHAFFAKTKTIYEHRFSCTIILLYNPQPGHHCPIQHVVYSPNELRCYFWKQEFHNVLIFCITEKKSEFSRKEGFTS